MKDQGITSTLRPDWTEPTARTRRPADLKLWPCLRLIAVTVLICLTVLLTIPAAYPQQTLDQAVTGQLQTGTIECEVLRAEDTSLVVAEFGPQLQAICADGGGVTIGGGVSAGGVAGTTQGLPVITARLVSLRDENGEEGRVSVASIDDFVIALGDSAGRLSGLNVFVSGGYSRLKRDSTTFEAGYDSNNWGVTAGVDYRFTDWFVAGLAANVSRWSGDIDIGGDFKVDSYGPIAYAAVFPLPGAFVQATLSYAHSNHDRTRPVSWRDPTATPQPILSGGNESGDFVGNEFGAQLIAGHDWTIGPFAIGPRVGVTYLHSRTDSYRESGKFLEGDLGNDFPALFNSSTPTGLELAFDDDSRTSLQSILGVDATAAFRVEGAVIVPQVFFDWRHEFRDDQRAIGVRFVQDNRPDPQRFSFDTEPPDRNFFNLGGGVSVLFDNGLQPFVAAQTLLGHRYYDATSVFVGLRMSLN